MRLRLIASLWLCLWATFYGSGLRAQTGITTVSGVILSDDKREPIPFASLLVNGKNIGTVSNEKGAFILKIPAGQNTGQLVVSSVGYVSQTLPLDRIGSAPLTIRLRLATIALQEVQVKAQRKSAADILREAVAAIPRNYDTTAVALTAFYREDTRFDNRPARYNEAVLSVYKSANNQPAGKDQLRLLKGRKRNIDPKTHNMPDFINLSNGARSSLYGDFVKLIHDKRNTFNERNHKYYLFSLQVLTGDRMLYVIDIQPNPKRRKGYVTGKVYIDAETLAFVRSDLRLTDQGLDHENNDNWLMKKMASMMTHLQFSMSGFSEITTYRQNPADGRWYLGNVERRYEALINSKQRNLTDKKWQVATSFTVTDVGPKGIEPFAEGDITETRNPMSWIVGDQNDPAFWEQYNIQQALSADTIPASQPATPAAAPAPAAPKQRLGNRQNGFGRADTLRGKLTPLRSSYDVLFYDLAVSVDIAKKSIAGRNRIRFRVLAPIRTIQLDLYANMAIGQITYNGRPLAYTREHNAVFVNFPETLPQGSQQAIEVDYSGTPQEADRTQPMVGGFLWQQDRDGNPWVQVVCQGSGASLWWPNKDHLSDKPDSMRIRVTVPAGLMTIANGRLRRTTNLPGNRTEYDWYVSYPINNYNVTLNIGKYAHWRDYYVSGDTLTLDYYAMPYNRKPFGWVFDGTKQMLATLEKHYGPYPFPRDGFTLMESLHPMEHQSAVSFGPLPAGRADSLSATDSLRIRQLVWHEASHEWWGNNVSCSDLADMWIHEAFASYSEGYCLETILGNDAELAYIASLPPQVIGNEPVAGVPDVNHIHYDIGDMYTKGSLMLYTFRHALANDSLWAHLLTGIQQHFRQQTIRTQDLVRYINTVTRTDYSWFFDQYLHHVGLPRLQLQLQEQADALVVRYRWAADVAGFRMPVSVTRRPGQYSLIRPTTAWQTMTLPQMSEDDFAVDTTRFYVTVEEH